MAYIEQELREYAKLRIGGRSPMAQALVAKAAQSARAALGALRRHGSTSTRFWNAF